MKFLLDMLPSFPGTFGTIIALILAIPIYVLAIMGSVPAYLYYLLVGEKKSFKELFKEDKIKESIVVGFCIASILFFIVMYQYNIEQIKSL